MYITQYQIEFYSNNTDRSNLTVSTQISLFLMEQTDHG